MSIIKRRDGGPTKHLQVALLTSTHSYPSLSKVHLRWVYRLEEEFFCQGDSELEAGLPVSPLMDRTKEGVTKSQPGFFTIVAMPMFHSFCSVFPACQPMLRAVKSNYQHWLADGAAPETAGPNSVLQRLRTKDFERSTSDLP